MVLKCKFFLITQKHCVPLNELCKRKGKATSRPLKKTYRQHNTLNIYSNGNKNNKQQACDDMG